ncbi:hypothetical protein CTEN210_14923 [Chaetoceros tenuissimus]|uniref:Uncharacterized protein n=1 Tax=Chaetoceros tenuissimus TaxID=426638 RepID=A0AAD3D6N1_9STRA|nr:hypothetical protein CTEN210_14923 [Chaetoceros tenuissimus]
MSNHSPPETPPSPLDPTCFNMGDASTPTEHSDVITHAVFSSKTTEENKEEFEAELTEDVNGDLVDAPVEASPAINDSSVHLQETMPSTNGTAMTKEELEAKLAEVTADNEIAILCALLAESRAQTVEARAQTVEAQKEVIELKLTQAKATVQALREQLQEANQALADKDAELVNVKQDTEQALADKDAELVNVKQDAEQALADKDAELVNVKQDTEQALADKDAELVNVKQDTEQALADMDAELAKLGPFKKGQKVHVFSVCDEEKVPVCWNGKILEVCRGRRLGLCKLEFELPDDYPEDVEPFEYWHVATIRRGWLE